MTEKATITIKTSRTFKLPTLPNILRTEGDEAVDVSTLDREQLREIGHAWTEALVRHAEKRRGERHRKLNAEFQKRGWSGGDE